MPKLPHIAWPFVLGATVEQDTPAQHRADAGHALCTPRGERDDVPTYGVTLPLLENVPVDVAAIAAELAESNPVLAAEIDDMTDLVDATVARLNVSLPS